MKTGKFSFVAIAFLAMVTSTICLDLLDVQEGSCDAIQDVTTLDEVDPTVLDRLYFISGGSKYQLYRYARGHLHFDELRDYKFFYEACLFKNISVEAGSGSTFGFGNQKLVTYDARRGTDYDDTGVALVTNERPGPGIETGEKFTSRITLTDNENFAVVAHCWEDVNQRGWSLYSSQYSINTDLRRMVEEHVLGLGFDRDNVAFLEYTDCRQDEDYDDLEYLDLDFHLQDEGEAPPPSFENIERFSSIVTGQNSKQTDSKNKDQSKGKNVSKDKSFSSTKKEKSLGSKDKSSSSPKDKSSEKSDTTKSSSKNTSNHPNKSTSSSKDKSNSKDKSSESSKNKSDSKKTSSHPNKSSSDSKVKSSENKNKSQSKHISSHSDKSVKDETSKIEHEEHHGKKETQKSNKKIRDSSHTSTHHSSEDDSSEEKFGKGSHRFQSRGYRRFGGVGGGWKR